MQDNKTNSAENISTEEKVQLLKDVFDSLEVVERAEFTNWCHEEIEKDTSEVLREKMQKGEEAFSSFVAKSYDKIVKAGTKVYNTTNEVFESVVNDKKEENNSEHTSKGSGIFD
jgi:hypothetical protein